MVLLEEEQGGFFHCPYYFGTVYEKDLWFCELGRCDVAGSQPRCHCQYCIVTDAFPYSLGAKSETHLLTMEPDYGPGISYWGSCLRGSQFMRKFFLLGAALQAFDFRVAALMQSRGVTWAQLNICNARYFLAIQTAEV